MATEATPQLKRPLRADAQRNYDNLVATARDLFKEEGTGASLEQVAKRAGVGIGTLYRHFPAREDLLVAVYVDEVEAMAAVADNLGRPRSVGRPVDVATHVRRLRGHQACAGRRAGRGW